MHGIERRSIPVDTEGKAAVGLVRINKRDGFLDYCSATLYQPDTLVTDKRCAISSNKGFRSTVFFENAKGDPEYEVQSSHTLSQEKSGTNHEVGILILEKAVTGITPEPLNANASLIITDLMLNYYSYDRSIPDAQPGTPSALKNLKRYKAQITDDEECVEIINGTDIDSPVNTTFCATGNGKLPEYCSPENRGGPFYLTGRERLGVIGVFTASEHCGIRNNSLIAANIADPDTQNFLIRQSGYKGRQSWRLQKDEGKQPAGFYAEDRYAHCVATIDGKTYTGYYYETPSSEDDTEGSGTMPSHRGCVIFRDHTVCLAPDFFHVVGPVHAEWTTPAFTPDNERISFTGSSNSAPCLRFIGASEYSQRDFPISVLGRWDNNRGVYVIRDNSKAVYYCNGVEDIPENGNLVTTPSDSLVGLLRQGQVADDSCGRDFRDEFIATTTVLVFVAVSELVAIAILSALLYKTCKKVPAKE